MCFGAHLTVQDALVFADALPAVLRAIFVETWRPIAEPAPFPDRAALTREVRANTGATTTSPMKTASAWWARALRASMDQAALDRALSQLPEAGRDYWAA